MKRPMKIDSRSSLLSRTAATPVTAYDVPRIQSAITRTIEFGYKGVVADKLVVAADLYQSRIDNYVGSVSVETPNVFLEPESLGAALNRGFEQTLSDPANALIAAGLQVVDEVQVPGLLEGNRNGSPVDELTAIFVAGAAAIPYGTVTPRAGVRSLRDGVDIPQL